MTERDTMDEVDVGERTNQVFQLLRDLDADTRRRVVSAALTLCGDSPSATSVVGAGTTGGSSLLRQPSFLEREDLSPKEFVRAKGPSTDIERVACLGYYLTHYRDTPHFRTLDISRLNTEAAQIKFANAAQAMKNASKAGLLATAGKRGLKQLSAAGEEYVVSLPDRDLAKKALGGVKRRKSRVSKKTD